MFILQQDTDNSWWGRIFHGGDLHALTGEKFSQWGRIFRENSSPGAKYTQQGGDKYRGAILIHDTGHIKSSVSNAHEFHEICTLKYNYMCSLTTAQNKTYNLVLHRQSSSNNGCCPNQLKNVLV